MSRPWQSGRDGATRDGGGRKWSSCHEAAITTQTFRVSPSYQGSTHQATPEGALTREERLPPKPSECLVRGNQGEMARPETGVAENGRLVTKPRLPPKPSESLRRTKEVHIKR